MTENEKLRSALRELRDACGDNGLDRIYRELGVVGIGEIQDTDAAIQLAERIISESSRKAGVSVRAQLSEMAEEHYAKLRGKAAK